MLSWQKQKIRTKIVLTLLPVLLPMLAIVAITYYSARNLSLTSSGHLGRQIVQTGAERANDFFILQDAKFQSWIQEDVYGLSIEFDTTGELGDRFQEMLAAAPGFSLLLLTDLGGKVLEASVRDKDMSSLKGHRVAETQQFPEFCPCYKRSSESVKSQSLSGFPNAPKIDSGRKNSLKIPRCSRRAKFYSLYFSMA